jgi:hypothetical protein
MRCASANFAAAHQIDYTEQDHRTDKSSEKGHRIKGIAAQMPTITDAEKPEYEAAEYRPETTDDDVEEDALLRIGTHNDAGEPADNATHDDCDDEIHDYDPYDPSLLPDCYRTIRMVNQIVETA